MPAESQPLTGPGSVAPSWGSVPQPDPTLLTATAVDNAKADLRRELQAMHTLTYARIDGMAKELDILTVAVSHVPSDREVLRERLQLDIRTAVENLKALHDEKFEGVQQQFAERDTRGEQEKKSSKEALDAALLAQKESVSQQNDANTTAATKSETSFTKQIDQIGTLIATLEKSLTDRITELKERIDRGEGGAAGSAGYRAEHRLDTGTVLQALITLAAVISVVIIVLKK